MVYLVLESLDEVSYVDLSLDPGFESVVVAVQKLDFPTWSRSDYPPVGFSDLNHLRQFELRIHLYCNLLIDLGLDSINNGNFT